MLKRDDWLKGTCTCPAYFKKYLCKHIIGIAMIKLPEVKCPLECKNQALGAKRNRGRAPQSVLALMRQPRRVNVSQATRRRTMLRVTPNLHQTSEVTFVHNTALPRYYEPSTTDYLPSNNFTAHESSHTMTYMTNVRLGVWLDLSAMYSVSFMSNTPDNSKEARVIN